MIHGDFRHQRILVRLGSIQPIHPSFVAKNNPLSQSSEEGDLSRYLRRT